MKVIIPFFRWAIILLLATPILIVVAYRFILVYMTPSMVTRCFKEGEIKMYYHWVPMDNISRCVSVTVMASKDQRFPLHHGPSYDVIGKAAVYNIRNETGKEHGVSVITQQTVGNVFLWLGHSWVRRGLEIYLAAFIELIWSKQRTMEVYLNFIEMGDMIYGVDAIVRCHLGKTASKSSRLERALIAVTLPNPIQLSSKAPGGCARLRQRKIEHEMKFIPSFLKEGGDINPNTIKGGIYHKKG